MAVQLCMSMCCQKGKKYNIHTAFAAAAAAAVCVGMALTNTQANVCVNVSVCLTQHINSLSVVTVLSKKRETEKELSFYRICIAPTSDHGTVSDNGRLFVSM